MRLPASYVDCGIKSAFTFCSRWPQLFFWYEEMVMCRECASGKQLPWWMNPRGKKRRSPASSTTSRMGFPISAWSKFARKENAKCPMHSHQPHYQMCCVSKELIHFYCHKISLFFLWNRFWKRNKMPCFHFRWDKWCHWKRPFWYLRLESTGKTSSSDLQM